MAVLVIAALLSFLAYGASVEDKCVQYDTIVVGMGASGVTAASELARGGRCVLALEAMGRIGGRVNTVPCGDGALELGAEWIHGQAGNPTYQIAMENDVNVFAQDMTRNVVWSDGSQGNLTLFNEIKSLVLEAWDDPPPQPEPLGQYLTRRILAFFRKNRPELLDNTDFISEYLTFAELLVMNEEAADSWNDTTTHSSYEDLEGSHYISWHDYGYHTIFEILLNTYNGGPGLPTLTVKLNTEVTKILWPDDPEGKVVVRTADCREYTADNVIVTASVRVLEETHVRLFEPRFPARKASSFASITLGVVDKIVLMFPEPWWPEDLSFGFMWRADDKLALPDEDWWISRIPGCTPPKGCDGALTLWTHGEAARHVETLPLEEVKSKSMGLLRRFLGANYTIPEPTGIYRTTWFSNPYTRGSYSFDNLLAPYRPHARADLAEPLVDSSGAPRVLFAGEATSSTHYSTVHGAIESGQREAARLQGRETPSIESRFPDHSR